MITFACKKIEHEELIRCSFNLNKTEYNVLMSFLKKKEVCTISEIAKTMKLERTTIQKAIKGLVNKKLVRRLQRNLPKGGYVFLYKVNNKQEIKNKMKSVVHKWYKLVEMEIDDL